MKKLYKTTKKIPWINTSMQDVPHWDINDNFFNWTENPSNTIFFETWNTGRIVVSSLDITYFKIVDTETNKITYWYVSKTLKVLKEGYEVQVVLDIYMTFGRTLLKAIYDTKEKPLMERMYFNYKMFKLEENIRYLIYYSFSLDDELMEDMKPSVKFNALQAENVEGSKFPWKLDYNLLVKVGAANQYAKDFYVHYQEDINDTKIKFTQNYGLYIVMMHGQSGMFHLYPINQMELELRIGGYENILSQFDPKVKNNYERLMRNVVNRKVGEKNHDAITLPSLNWDGIRDIDKFYTDGSFVGVFKGPVINRKDTPMSLHLMLEGAARPIQGTPLTYYLVGYYYIILDPQKPIETTLPFTQQINEDLVETYINGMENLWWGSNPVKMNKFISHYEFNKPQNTLSDPNTYKAKFNINFLNEFIAVPKYNAFNNETDMISFGGNLPSASTEYTEEMRKIKQTFNAGLANSIWGVIQGGPSALGKLAAADLWGITSAVGSAFTFGRDITNLALNKKNAMKSIKATYLNTNSYDWYNVSTKISKAIGIVDRSYTMRPDDKYLEDWCVYEYFTQEQRDQIKFIINNYGYKLNQPINLYTALKHTTNDVVPMKFNAEWLALNYNRILNNQEHQLEVQEAVINHLSNGIRLHMGVN